MSKTSEKLFIEMLKANYHSKNNIELLENMNKHKDELIHNLTALRIQFLKQQDENEKLKIEIEKARNTLVSIALQLKNVIT